MRKSLSSAALFLGICLLNSQCIDSILFPITDTTNGIMVISGQLTDLDEPQYVYLSRSSVNNEKPTPVRLAEVSLETEAGEFFSYSEISPGRYQLKGISKGEPGKSYKISVKTGNKLYTSDIETMPTAIGSDSLYYEITEESFSSNDQTRITHLLNVFSKSELPTDGNYFWRWDPTEVYYIDLTNFPDPFNSLPPDCFGSDRVDPQRINLLNGKLLKKKIHQHQIATREIDYSFKNRHYIISRLLCTTQASYEYWNKVKSILSNSGNPFDIPPATIPGNVKSATDDKELVLGYFEVCRAKETRFFLVPGWIPYPIEPYCDFDPAKSPNEYPPLCLDCSKVPNGTAARPPWF